MDSSEEKPFVIRTDPNGTPYVTTNMTEVNKNHQGGNKQSEMDCSDGRMFGLGVKIYNWLRLKLHPLNVIDHGTGGVRIGHCGADS